MEEKMGKTEKRRARLARRLALENASNAIFTASAITAEILKAALEATSASENLGIKLAIAVSDGKRMDPEAQDLLDKQDDLIRLAFAAQLREEYQRLQDAGDERLARRSTFCLALSKRFGKRHQPELKPEPKPEVQAETPKAPEAPKPLMLKDVVRALSDGRFLSSEAQELLVEKGKDKAVAAEVIGLLDTLIAKADERRAGFLKHLRRRVQSASQPPRPERRVQPQNFEHRPRWTQPEPKGEQKVLTPEELAKKAEEAKARRIANAQASAEKSRRLTPEMQGWKSRKKEEREDSGKKKGGKQNKRERRDQKAA